MSEGSLDRGIRLTMERAQREQDSPFAELRRLAEQAKAEKDWQAADIFWSYIAAANPAALLSLLDERDEWEQRANWHRDNAVVAEQRVSALEEGLRGLEQKAKTGAWHEKVRGGYLWAIDDARQLLQASAQDASEGSGK